MSPCIAPRPSRGVRSRRVLAPLGVLLLLAATACSDNPLGAPPPVAPPSASVAPQSTGDVIIEAQTFDRFTVDIDASGAFRPGVPVQIKVVTTAHLESPRAQLRVVVPELASSISAAAPTKGKAQGGRSVKARDSWTASIAKNAANHHVAHVVFPKPGIYHVSAEVTHPSDDGRLLVDGKHVQNVASEMIVLEVTAQGVKARKQDTPVELMMIPICDDPTQIDCEPVDDPPPPPPSYVQWVWTAVWYSGPEMTTYEPVRRARVNYSGSGVPTGSSTTDDGGYVQLPCNGTYGGNTNITVTLDGPDVRMTATWTSVSTTINMGSLCYGGGWVAWYNWSEGRAWDNFLKTIDGSRGYFGYARGQVKARVGGVASCPTSCWLNGSNEILIYPNSVWGVWGEFVASHEYGHALHAGSPFGLRVCGGSHSWDDTRQDGCLALDEGFASYSAFTSRGPGELAPYYAWHEADFRRTTCPGTGSCETRVTAFLMDLSDPVDASDPDGYYDNLQLPARQVFDMIGYCSLSFELYDWEYQYVVDRWTQYQRGGLSEVYDCLKKEYPLRIGSMYYPPTGRNVDINIWNIWTPWAGITGQTLADVTTRISR